MSSKKIIVSGNIIEVYEYEKSLNIVKRKDDVKPVGRAGNGNVERQGEYKQLVNYRARQNIRRLILANFKNNDLFITLTFEDNITFLEVANKAFKQFIQRCKRRYGNFKYLAVIEYQKRGAIHYHMMCDLSLESLEGDTIKEKEVNIFKYVWGMGFVDIKDVKNVDNTGAYLVKYLQKGFNREFEDDKKRYLCSKNLVKPHVVDFEDFKDINNYVNGLYPVFTSTYNSLINGDVKYSEYNLLRGENYK